MRTTLVSLLALTLFGCNNGCNSRLDADGDGFAGKVDCDDNSEMIHPDMVELCDGVDNNCNGEIDEGATNTFYADKDEDGWGDANDWQDACQQPDGYVTMLGDCNDDDGAFHPGASETDCTDANDYNCDGSVMFADIDGDGAAACQDCNDNEPLVYDDALEVCDGLDNNCNGLVDTDTLPVDLTRWYIDYDTDGYGSSSYTVAQCASPGYGWVDNADDCDDNQPTVFPGGTEVCDELDNDCDGEIDGLAAEDALTVYADLDGDGFGDPATKTAACDAFDGWVTEPGDCDDDPSTGFEVNPDALEVCNDSIDNDCSGDYLGCELDLTSADSVLLGEMAEDYAGVSITSAGDVDLDGTMDLLIGAKGVDDGVGSEGAVYMMFGPVSRGTMSLSSAELKLYGNNSGDDAGRTIRSLEDFDGDSIPDVAVSAPTGSDYGSKTGSVYLLSGADLANMQPGSHFLGDVAGTWFAGDRNFDWLGSGVASAGDVNGDGLTDVLMSASANDTAAANAGAIYLIFGNEGWADSGGRASDVADAIWTGESAGVFASPNLLGPGDIDGDGLDEIAVGVPLASVSGSFSGAVYLINANAAAGLSSLGDADARMYGQAAEDRAGAALAAPGDVNADGYADIFIGISRDDIGGADAGAVALVLGASDLVSFDGLDIQTNAAAIITGADPGDGLGEALASGADWDSDGVNDLVAGAQFEGINEEGAAYLVLGPWSGTTDIEETATAKFVGDFAQDHAGSSVGMADDLYGNGQANILVGAWQDDENGVDAGAAYIIDTIGL